jgi:UDP-glucose:(heptosyl)LPS alpha-1,3-glucosyltransferase
LQRRDAASSVAQRIVRSILNRHRDTLEMEAALFRGGAGRVIVNSRMVEREAQEDYGYPAEKIHVIPNGVPLDEFQPQPGMRETRRRSLGLAESDIAVLFVGSGWQRKGLRFAREAVESLGGAFRLLVAGRGGRQPRKGKQVNVLGTVRDLPAVYAAADIFLLPTLYDPFSNACLEALASGLPVITTRANGFSEIIEDGVHGTILESPTNAWGIAAALLSWADPARRESARARILERASHYDISTNVERTFAILSQAASAAAGSGKIRNT